MTHFISIFVLFQWPGIIPTISLWCACTEMPRAGLESPAGSGLSIIVCSFAYKALIWFDFAHPWDLQFPNCNPPFMVFPVVMYGCESWTIKKAECQRIDAFELWCWRRLLRVPWTERRSNQSILKEISPEYSLEGCNAEAPILLPPDGKNWLTGKDPAAGNEWRWEETEQQRRRWLDGITDKLRELVMDREA